MQVVGIEAFGGVEQFKDLTIPIPPVKENEVRIRMKASSFNPVDYKIRKGMFGGDLPMVLGNDGAGIIDEVGAGVTKFKKGDEVYAFLIGPKSNGGHAEYVTIAQQFVSLKPSSLSFEDSAGFPIAGLTAMFLVDKAKPVKGQPVFVTGASGGVGSILLYLLRDIGAYPIVTTAGSDASAEYSNWGIPKEHIVRYDKSSLESLAEQAKTLLPSNYTGFPISIDLWGGDMKKLSFMVLGMDGHVLTIVEEPSEFVTPLYPSLDSKNSLFSNNASFSMVFIGARAFSPFIKDPSGWAVYSEDLDKLAKMIDEGRVKAAKTTKVGNLKASDVAKAHQQLEGGHTKGKLVISIP